MKSHDIDFGLRIWILIFLQDAVGRVKEAAFLREDDGRFVYCLQRRSSDCYNPYDLRVTCANEAKMAAIYWTVSASSVTRIWYNAFFRQEEYDTVPTLQWLFEKERFEKIKQLKAFKYFR